MIVNIKTKVSCPHCVKLLDFKINRLVKNFNDKKYNKLITEDFLKNDPDVLCISIDKDNVITKNKLKLQKMKLSLDKLDKKTDEYNTLNKEIKKIQTQIKNSSIEYIYFPCLDIYNIVKTEGRTAYKKLKDELHNIIINKSNNINNNIKIVSIENFVPTVYYNCISDFKKDSDLLIGEIKNMGEKNHIIKDKISNSITLQYKNYQKINFTKDKIYNIYTNSDTQNNQSTRYYITWKTNGNQFKDINGDIKYDSNFIYGINRENYYLNQNESLSHLNKNSKSQSFVFLNNFNLDLYDSTSDISFKLDIKNIDTSNDISFSFESTNTSNIFNSSNITDTSNNQDSNLLFLYNNLLEPNETHNQQKQEKSFTKLYSKS